MDQSSVLAIKLAGTRCRFFCVQIKEGTTGFDLIKEQMIHCIHNVSL